MDEINVRHSIMNCLSITPNDGFLDYLGFFTKIFEFFANNVDEKRDMVGQIYK